MQSGVNDHDLPETIARPPAVLRAEIVVVGSGPGGAVTACLLAEGGRDVLLVEEGPYVPPAACEPFSPDAMLRKYRRAGLTLTMGRPKIAFVEACCVGGGSEVNAAMYCRTPPEVLDRWRRQYRVAGLSEADLEPHFEASERDLHVCHEGQPFEAGLRLERGAEKLGWSARVVPRCIRTDVASPTDSLRYTRQTMTRTYLPRFLRAGGKLLPQARVLHLVRGRYRWRAAAEHRAADGGRPRRIILEADKIFLAGGAIQTPNVLRRSGLRRNIGRSLQMHVFAKAVARFPEPVNPGNMGVPHHHVYEFFPRFTLECATSTPAHLALVMAGHPRQLPQIATQWPRMAAYSVKVCGGRGSIHAVPFLRDPIVRYRLEEGDLLNVAAGMKALAQALLAAGAEAVFPAIDGCPSLAHQRDLEHFPQRLPPRAITLTTIHLMASCPMGENRSVCAADSFGKVHGLDGLYLADASLLCGPPGVNPQGTIMAIVHRNAMRFLNQA